MSIETGGPFEEGDNCGIAECNGTLGFNRVVDCYCHISPPCSPCIENPLVCLECGNEPADAMIKERNKG